MKLVGLAVIIAIFAVADAGWWWGCWWGWGYRCCTPYSSETHVCCKERRDGCCKGHHLHSMPPCTNSSVPTYRADPCNCAKYYQCYQGQLNHFTCPIRGAWNQAEVACKKTRNLLPDFCGSRPYRPHCLSAVYGQYNLTAYNGVTNETVVSFVDLAPHDSVYNIMSYFAGNRDDFSFNATFHKIFWYSITCINGVCANYPQDMTYWSFKVNGVTSNVGVSTAIGHDGDEFMFVLTKGGGH